MFASLLVLLDGSPASDSALRLAASSAGILGARVRGLMVEDERRFLYFPPINAMSAALGAAPTIPVPLPPEDLVRVQNDVSDERKAVEERYDAVTSGAGLQAAPFSSVRGDVVEELLLASHTADLVLMGCRTSAHEQGATDPGEKIEPLLRNTHRPVVVVPEGQHAFNKLLVAYDQSDGARRAIREGAAIAKLCGAGVEVMTVSRSDADAKEALDEASAYLEPWGLEVATHRATGSARKAIVTRAQEIDAGLLVMGAFGHNRISEFLFGSATRHVLEHMPCPVLLTRH